MDIKHITVAIGKSFSVYVSVCKNSSCKQEFLAFDNGPANALIDLAVQKFYNKSFDENGEIGLSVDFDNKVFISYCPEPLNLEEYVPDGWTGKYELFTDRIPKDKVFW